jgi:hypothetical protein
MLKPMTLPLIAGLLAGGLFLFIFDVGLGFLFMFLPILPIMLAGFARSAPVALQATLIATIAIGAVANTAAAVLFLIFFGLPAWYIVRQGQLSRIDGAGTRQWMPAGPIFVHLAIAASVLVALVVAYWAGTPGGLPGMIAERLPEIFADLSGEYGDVVHAMATDWSFMVFSATVWLWGLAFYAHAWLALRLLAYKHIPARPVFTLVTFAMPNWLLSLLAICALASLIGSVSMSFLGKATLITLLLPYFFLGAAIMHQRIATWPNRSFLFFFMYFLAFAQFWPALMIAGIGLVHHIKRLSSAGTSSKS